MALDVILHESLNTNITVLRDEPGEIVNVLTALGAGDGLAQLRLVLQDDDSIELYGRRTGTFEDGDIEDPAALDAGAREYLNKAAWPQLELQANTVIDSTWPDIRVGDYIRVVSPKGIDAVVRILEENRQCADAETVTLGLNTELKSIIDVIVGGGKKIPPVEKVPAPTNLAAIGGHQFVELVWTGNADYFVIEHSTNGYDYAVLEPRWTGRKYLHQGLELGSRHWYKVYAVRGSIRSDVSGPAEAIAKDEIPPAKPTGVAVSSLIKGIMVRFNPPQEVDWRDSSVHISTSQGFVPGPENQAAQGRQNRFELTGLEIGQKYYVRVIHYDMSGNASEASDEVNAVAGAITADDTRPGDFFRVHQTGIVVVPARGIVSVPFPQLPYRPACLAYFQGENQETAGKSVLTYYVYFEGSGVHSWGAWVYTDESNVYIQNFYRATKSFRYYVFKEEGISI